MYKGGLSTDNSFRNINEPICCSTRSADLSC